jgi:hypothetical protein
MPATRRLLIFRLITGTILGICLLFIITKGYDIYEALGNMKFEDNDGVNKRNTAYASAHRFGFTDIERSTSKPKGVFRIAVLGDSFIWGDGLPYEKVWSHKLERKLSAQYDSIEVMSWGICGWSTLDEFNFYKAHGHDYDIDLLIIGWVDNDPDIGKIPRALGGNAETDHPLVYQISPAFARSMLNVDNNNDYDSWMKYIYSDQNLKGYQTILNEFKAYLAQIHIPAIVVMTPSPSLNHGDDQEHFDLAKPLILRAGFICFDLLPLAEKNLRQYSNTELQANPVNGHPGDIMTEEFSNDVKLYLEQHHYLSKLHKKNS